MSKADLESFDGISSDDQMEDAGVPERKHYSGSKRDSWALDHKGRQAHERNMQRIQEAQEMDTKLIGKHLPSDAGSFFPHRLSSPDDWLAPPGEWVEKLRKLSRKQRPTPSAGDISFGLKEDDLVRNAVLLQQHDYDLGKLLASQNGTTVEPGSEFREWEDVLEILDGHPGLEFLESLFCQGLDYHYTTKLSDEQRALELEAQLSYGNHRSARADSNRVTELLARDVKHGFAIPLPVESIKLMKGAAVQPCGIVKQFSLEADGSRSLKARLTHDLSHSLTREDASVNSRIDMSRYPEMVYGWCLVRIIHFVVCLRAEHPEVEIYVQKFDYSDAYRRISHTPQAAAQTILVWMGVAYLMVRLAFGGSPNPAGFCGFSEILTDLANEISCARIEPSEFLVPTVEPKHLIPERYPTPETAFRRGILPAVVVPVGLQSRKDCFIDDIINVFLGTRENLGTECFSIPLAAHLLSRPHAGDGNEPVPRKPLFAANKLEAEGRPSEIRIVLGWGIDTRRMVMFLPEDKYQAWLTDLRETTKEGRTTAGQLESLIGRLNHTAMVIPLSRHFLNNIRRKISKRRPPTLTLRLSAEEQSDLLLWEKFLIRARGGIPMDLLTVRTPTIIGWSDSCPFGLGGYTMKGSAWRLKVPKWAAFYNDDTVNNILEFLGMAINILVMLEETRDEAFPCLLALGDNTSAIGWLFRSSRIGPDSVYFQTVQLIARKIAEEAMKAEAQVNPQHLSGETNEIADMLSFAGTARGKEAPLTIDEPPDEILTRRILENYPQVVPEAFSICDLSEEIFSFVCVAMRTLESSWTRNRKRAMRVTTDPGGGGPGFSCLSDYEIRSWMSYKTTSAGLWPSVSLSFTARQDSTGRGQLLGDVRSRWWRRLCAMPQAMWLRRFGCINGTAPSTTKEAWEEAES